MCGGDFSRWSGDAGTVYKVIGWVGVEVLSPVGHMVALPAPQGLGSALQLRDRELDTEACPYMSLGSDLHNNGQGLVMLQQAWRSIPVGCNTRAFA